MNPVQHAAFCKRAIQRIMEGYPSQSPKHPQTYVEDLMRLMGYYPRPAIETLLDPLTGIKTRCQFLPTVAEIKVALVDASHEISKSEHPALAAPSGDGERIEFCPPPPYDTDGKLEARIHDLSKRIYEAHGTLPVIDRRTDVEQWKAWRIWRIQNRQPVVFMDRQDRWTVLTPWPLADFDELERKYS